MNVIKKSINNSLLSFVSEEYSRNFCFYGVAYDVEYEWYNSFSRIWSQK